LLRQEEWTFERANKRDDNGSVTMHVANTQEDRGKTAGERGGSRQKVNYTTPRPTRHDDTRDTTPYDTSDVIQVSLQKREFGIDAVSG